MFFSFQKYVQGKYKIYLNFYNLIKILSSLTLVLLKLYRNKIKYLSHGTSTKSYTYALFCFQYIFHGKYKFRFCLSQKIPA